MSESELVETPAGMGRLVALAEIPGGWHVRVELSDGGTWIGSAEELRGPCAQKALQVFRSTLDQETERLD